MYEYTRYIYYNNALYAVRNRRSEEIRPISIKGRWRSHRVCFKGPNPLLTFLYICMYIVEMKKNVRIIH